MGIGHERFETILILTARLETAKMSLIIIIKRPIVISKMKALVYTVELQCVGYMYNTCRPICQLK